MQFGKIIFEDWEYVSPTQWFRIGRDGTELSPFFSSATVELVKIYGRHFHNSYSWYPEFHGKIDHLNEIYAKSTSFKEFKYNEEKEAMKFTDDFLIRMNKLMVFG